MGDVAVGDRGTLLVTPLAPARSGNGLAMRAGLLLEALAGLGPVDVVVVPISGPAQGDDWLTTMARTVVVVTPPTRGSRADVVAELADPARRSELASLEGLPGPVHLAPPSLAPTATGAVGDARPGVVVVLRAYLGPFGLTLARELGAARVVVDADDDDEARLRARGDDQGADAYARLSTQWLARADRVLAASPVDAAALAERAGFAVDTLPNAVRLPDGAPSSPPRRDRVLYVGNLTYAPNVDAVRVLVDDVFPALREVIPGATVDVVGRYDDRLAGLGTRPGVRLPGAVDDLAPWYSGADVVVVPLREGAGTRIKVLEAFAHRRPVVATPAAVAGLAVVDGRSVVLGASAAELAAHAARLLRVPDEASRIVAGADAVLAEHYLLDDVVARARRLLTG